MKRSREAGDPSVRLMSSNVCTLIDELMAEDKFAEVTQVISTERSMVPTWELMNSMLEKLVFKDIRCDEPALTLFTAIVRTYHRENMVKGGSVFAWRPVTNPVCATPAEASFFLKVLKGTARNDELGDLSTKRKRGEVGIGAVFGHSATQREILRFFLWLFAEEQRAASPSSDTSLKALLRHPEVGANVIVAPIVRGFVGSSADTKHLMYLLVKLCLDAARFTPLYDTILHSFKAELFSKLANRERELVDFFLNIPDPETKLRICLFTFVARYDIGKGRPPWSQGGGVDEAALAACINTALLSVRKNSKRILRELFVGLVCSIVLAVFTLREQQTDDEGSPLVAAAGAVVARFNDVVSADEGAHAGIVGALRMLSELATLDSWLAQTTL